MPTFKRSSTLDLHYTLDDITDPWVDRPYLVLQHGNGRSAAFWYRWIPLLAGRYRITCPNMRGLGMSVGQLDLDEDITLDALIGDLLAILDHAGRRSGSLLRRVDGRHSRNRVTSLTLVSTPVFIEDQMKERYALGRGSRIEAMQSMGMEAWVRETTQKTRLPADEEPELFEWYIREFAKGDPDVQVAMSKLVNGANAAGFLTRILVPILGLYPSGGQITSDAQVEMLKDGLANFSDSSPANRISHGAIALFGGMHAIPRRVLHPRRRLTPHTRPSFRGAARTRNDVWI